MVLHNNHVERGKIMANSSPPKVILIAIDSLDPAYVSLNSQGEAGGTPGDWLMPNVREFLSGGTWLEHARSYMPSATDMNHMNALAGTYIGQTGINLVGKQFFDWEEDGSPNIVDISYSFLRDSQGNRVDTLFNLWKRKWSNSKCAYITGKQWVGNIFNDPNSGVNIIVGGSSYPDYVTSPSGLESPKNTSLRQKILMKLLEVKPEEYPCDAWVVDTALKVLNQEKPDLSVILLGQMDDMQHVLGAGSNPKEFIVQISKYNVAVRREPILEEVKEIDEAFGTLIRGIRSMSEYNDATLVLYSDHGHLTHRDVDYIKDWIIKSIVPVPDLFTNTDVVKVLKKAGFFNRRIQDGIGFCVLAACSFGVVHIEGDTLEQRQELARKAKYILLNHLVWDHFTGSWECPWYVLDMHDMQNGHSHVTEEGELYHPYFAMNNKQGTMHWPDLFIFMKDHWELPISSGTITNLGMDLPPALAEKAARANLLFGGHGSNDTDKIIICFQGQDIASGKVVHDPHYIKNFRISDIAMTIAEKVEGQLQGIKVGKSRLKDITET